MSSINLNKSGGINKVTETGESGAGKKPLLEQKDELINSNKKPVGMRIDLKGKDKDIKSMEIGTKHDKNLVINNGKLELVSGLKKGEKRAKTSEMIAKLGTYKEMRGDEAGELMRLTEKALDNKAKKLSNLWFFQKPFVDVKKIEKDISEERKQLKTLESDQKVFGEFREVLSGKGNAKELQQKLDKLSIPDIKDGSPPRDFYFKKLEHTVDRYSEATDLLAKNWDEIKLDYGAGVDKVNYTNHLDDSELIKLGTEGRQEREDVLRDNEMHLVNTLREGEGLLAGDEEAQKVFGNSSLKYFVEITQLKKDVGRVSNDIKNKISKYKSDIKKELEWNDRNLEKSQIKIISEKKSEGYKNLGNGNVNKLISTQDEDIKFLEKNIGTTESNLKRYSSLNDDLGELNGFSADSDGEGKIKSSLDVLKKTLEETRKFKQELVEKRKVMRGEIEQEFSVTEDMRKDERYVPFDTFVTGGIWGVIPPPDKKTVEERKVYYRERIVDKIRGSQVKEQEKIRQKELKEQEDIKSLEAGKQYGARTFEFRTENSIKSKLRTLANEKNEKTKEKPGWFDFSNSSNMDVFPGTGRVLGRLGQLEREMGYHNVAPENLSAFFDEIFKGNAVGKAIENLGGTVDKKRLKNIVSAMEDIKKFEEEDLK